MFIEDCVIAGFTQKGIEVNTTAPCAVMLNNVTVHNVYDAITITNEGGAVAINNCRFQTVTNAGINLLNGQVTLSHSNIADCRTAVISAAKTSILLADNVICNNETAFQAAGTITSAGNNLVAGNKVQGMSMTVVKLQ